MSAILVWTILIVIVSLPSYLIANHRAHPIWRRLFAAVLFPAILFLWAAGFPTYPPGKNKDDWRRGCFMGVARIAAIASVATQLVIVGGRVVWTAAARRRSP